MTDPKSTMHTEQKEAADRQQLGKQLYEALRQWYELVENRQLFSTEPFESLEESEREILGKCAAQLKESFTKDHVRKVEYLQKQITSCRITAFDIAGELSRVHDLTHREKNVTANRAVSMLLTVANPLVHPESANHWLDDF